MNCPIASQDVDVSQSSPPDSSAPDENNGEEEKPEQTLPQSTAKDTVPPTIHTDIKSAIVHDANLFFSGNAHDDNSVAKLFVNQNPLEIRQGNLLVAITIQTSFAKDDTGSKGHFCGRVI